MFTDDQRAEIRKIITEVLAEAQIVQHVAAVRNIYKSIGKSMKPIEVEDIQS